MKTVNKNNRMAMFATKNDTHNYLLMVDGLFGFITKEQADNFDLDVENNPFGSWQILEPNYTPISGFTGLDATETKISEGLPIDIMDYVSKRPIRAKRNRPILNPTPQEKMELIRFDRDWFYDKSPLGIWQ